MGETKGARPQSLDNGVSTRPMPTKGADMKDLQEATEKICDLKGSLMAVETLMNAFLRCVPPNVLPSLEAAFHEEAEIARVGLLSGLSGESLLSAFERDIQRTSASLDLMRQDSRGR